MGKKKKHYTPPKDTKQEKQNVQYMKILLFTVVACALVTLCWIAAQCAELQKDCLYLGVGISVITCFQLFEKRTSHWPWSYIIFLCVLFSACTCVMILLSGVYWCFTLWAIELAGCIAFAVDRRRKKKK